MQIPGSDEEDDIESLRLAALQSLKRRESFSLNSDSSPHFRGKGSRNKWGRFGSHQRPGKTVRYLSIMRLLATSYFFNLECLWVCLCMFSVIYTTTFL